MPIEFLGWTIGDIAAIGALIASPLILWVGYRRTTRTEEMKTVSDCMNKIEKAYRTAYVFKNEKLFPNDSNESKTQWFLLYTGYLVELQMNI